MRLTVPLLAICAVALVQLTSALTVDEIQKFAASKFGRRNVTVTDNGDGTLTLEVSMPCRSPCSHFPSRLCKTRDPEDPDDDDDDKTVVVTVIPAVTTGGPSDGSDDGLDNGSGDKEVVVSASGEEDETLVGYVSDLMEDVAERVDLASKARKSIRVRARNSRRGFRIHFSRRYSIAFAVQRAFAVLGFDTNDDGSSGETCTKVVRLSVNKNPEYSPDPTCVPSGMIGFGVGGRPLFNHIREPRRRPKSCKKWRFARRQDDDDDDDDDSTDDFAERMRQWLDDPADEEKEGARQAFRKSRRYLEADKFLGVALDGFPIYGANASDVAGRLLNVSDLDQCGGRCVNGQYRYHAVKGRKFVLGCIKGEVSPDVATRISGGVGGGKCRYAVSCDAAATAGVCGAGAAISADFTCIPAKRRRAGSSSEDMSGRKSRRGRIYAGAKRLVKKVRGKVAAWRRG